MNNILILKGYILYVCVCVLYYCSYSNTHKANLNFLSQTFIIPCYTVYYIKIIRIYLNNFYDIFSTLEETWPNIKRAALKMCKCTSDNLPKSDP